ncbi:MAG: WD40 repeat domain-containing protein [Verrucomicrobiales bacterium]|nr:WD40 repeat domain-containing protein [Verrucomicrobiales bacterium]
MASVSNDGDLKLWSLDRGVELSIATAGGGFSLSKEHRKIITAVNFSPDGKWFATGSKDGMISLWDSETRTRLSAFTEHLTYVNRVVFRPDGRQLATVAGDGRVLLWDISTDGKLGLNAAETEFVVSAAVSPEAVVLATGTNTGKIILRDATTGRMLRDALTGAEVEPIKAHDDWVTYLDFTPDGGLLASGSSDSAVKIWDTRTREEIHSLDGHANAVNGVDFSPDGSLLASASDDGTVKVWDVDTGKCLRSLSNGREVANDIEFDPNGSLLAMAWSDGSIELLGLDKSSTPETVLVGHTESVYCIAFSPNGLLLASGSDDNSMRLWNVVTGKEVNYNGVGEALYSLAFSPDGNSVARGLESGVIDVKSLHYDEDGDVTTGSSVFSNSHSLEVTELFFTPDGNRLVSCGSDGTAKIWDMCRTAELSDWSVRSDDVGVECVAFSPDGKLLIAGADEGTLSVVDAQTGAKLGVFQGEKGVSCLAFSFDGLSFAKGSYDASLLLFDAGSGMILKSFYGNTEPVRSLAFSPTGRTLASGGDGGELRLWDIESGAELHSLKADGTVFSIAFSTDGMLLAAGTSVGIQLWDLKSATRLSPIGEGNNAAICVAFSPDGKHLASGGSDRVVSLWNLTDQRFERAFPVERQIDSLAFSPDAKTLSCAAGREVRLWDLATGVQLANFAEHAGVVWSVAFSPDGNRLASASTKGEVKIWDTKRGPIADSWSGPSAGGGNSVGDAETIQGDKLNLQQFSDRRLVTRLDDSVSSRHTTNSLSRDLPLPLIPVRRDTLGRLADPNLTGTERAELRMLYCAETRQPRAARALWKQLVEGSFDTGATSKLRTYYLKALIYGALEQRERDPKFTKVLMHDISTLLGRENLADASLAFTAFNLLERIVVSPETDDSVFSEGGLFRILEESGPPRSHHRLAALLDLCLKGDMLSVGSRDRLRAVLQDFGRRHPDSIEVQFFVRIAEIDALPPRSPDWLREVIELPKYLNGDSSVLIELGELALESSGAPLLALESNGAVELLQIMFSGDEYFETDEDWILACIDWSARIDEFEKAIQFAERLDTADAWRRLAAHQGGEAALASWDRVLKDQGAILEDFVKAGLVATKLEKLGKLREIYNVAQQSFPNKMGELNYLFADALYSLRETEESIQRLERTIEDPGDLVVGDAYVGLSLVLRGAGRESESKGVLSKFSSKADSLQQYLEHLLYRSDENSAFKTAGHFEVLPSLFLEFLKQPRDRESFDVFGLFGYCFLLSQDESIALDAFARARDTSDASHQYESALLLGEAVAHWKLDQAEFAISKFRELITMGEFLGEEFDWSSEEAIAEMGGNPIFISAINEIRAAAVVEDADRHPASGAEQSIDITPKSAMSDAGTFPMSNLYSSSNSLVDQAISQWRSGDNDGAIATFRMLISTGSLTTPPTDWSDPKVVEQLDLGEFDRLTVEAVRAEAVKGFPILTSPRTPSSSFRGPQKTEPQKPPTEIIDFSPIRLSRP